MINGYPRDSGLPTKRCRAYAFASGVDRGAGASFSELSRYLKLV